jgi:hypothetical protein
MFLSPQERSAREIFSDHYQVGGDGAQGIAYLKAETREATIRNCVFGISNLGLNRAASFSGGMLRALPILQQHEDNWR